MCYLPCSSWPGIVLVLSTSWWTFVLLISWRISSSAIFQCPSHLSTKLKDTSLKSQCGGQNNREVQSASVLLNDIGQHHRLEPKPGIDIIGRMQPNLGCRFCWWEEIRIEEITSLILLKHVKRQDARLFISINCINRALTWTEFKLVV